MMMMINAVFPVEEEQVNEKQLRQLKDLMRFGLFPQKKKKKQQQQQDQSWVSSDSDSAAHGHPPSVPVSV